MAANTQQPQDEPPIRAVGFSHKPEVMQVSTALRRLWLLDPEGLGLGSNPQGDGSQSRPLEEVFPEVIRKVGSWVAQAPEEDRWNDSVWKSQNELALLESPVASPAELDDCEPGKGPLFTPWRQQIYGVYNHVFFDVYNELKDKVGPDAIGEFQPPNTVVMVLRAPDDGGGLFHDFPVDTFMYPVWIAPGTTLTLSVGKNETLLTPDGHTWNYALWFRGGQVVIARPQTDLLEPCEAGHVVAVFVLGLCEERLVPRIELEDHTIGAHRLQPADAKPWAKDAEEQADDRVPESWPEADHLARALFLNAGDAVEKCGFDDVLDGGNAEAKREEQLEAKLEELKLNTQPGDSNALYSPLPGNNSIRILVIEPAPTEEAALQTRLRVVSLADQPSYEAISYTWGDPADATLLNCNGAQVSIPHNLENALKRLRHPSQPRHVWADSVCINQQDIPERGQQVSIMRNIYQQAKRVLVWLGLDERDQASTAFAAVCDVVRAWRPDGDRLSFASYASRLEPMSEDELASVRAAVDQGAWEALRALFEMNYFRRFWIIQELALGRSAVLLWGRHHISWGLVGICAAWMMSSGWSFQSGAPITAAYNAFLIYALPLARRSGISPFSKLDLSLVLGTTIGRFDSTDARDRIYALLGMPFAGNDPDADLLVKPDYSKDLGAVYTQAAHRMLEQDQHLRLLSAVHHDAEIDPSRPSWVPQWHQTPSAEPLALSDEQGFYAAGGEVFTPAASSPDDPDALHLTGLLCHTISSTSAVLRPPNLHITAPTDPAHRKALQTLFAELTSEARQFRASWSATLEKFTLIGFRDPAVQAELAGPGSKSVAVTAQPGKYGMRRGAEILQGERAQTDHLGEFLLGGAGDWGEGGDERVGLGPEAARPGDVVAVLFGAIVPFVLRPFDGPEGRKCWKLVGECFVPGLMQGEAVEEAGLLAESTFRRAGDGTLNLSPVYPDELDPRLKRKVGEHGICAFEIR
ncbi:heterokaryon incompatibility protein-domain-containing protein [Staphylotrichum tortipilum]|uniref:Heterokaryon incompatibility protein-domain-containing protein n=1 Tax=Staphylotrichum tortipilum TaxID=2831512 RepID=A0AAN6MPK5_9PEZI|nr:heterokaryon incompatibility protein-domain-containing protein [Staphylotrichum longicolle]